MGTCSQEGCGKPTVARGLCQGHYSSWRYRTKRAKPRVKQLCKIEGCDQKHQGRGFCNQHYQQWLRAERAKERDAAGLTRKRKKCTVEGCDGFVNGQGLCSKHYQRARIQSTLDGLPTCSRDGCQRKAHSMGLCNLHYSGLTRRRRGIEERPPPPPDGRYYMPNGYVTIFRPGHPNAGPSGHITEHRFFMAEHIGRALFSHENVHHKNGDRTDNRIENLELWSTSQPRGQRVEDKIQWCREFLAQYKGMQPP